MNNQTTQILFSLLRSAITEENLSEKERETCSSELLPEILKIASDYDVAHLLVLGLKQNGLISETEKSLENYIFKAVFRYERMKHEYQNICNTLEKFEIPFLPLKGAVLREYYPKPWMRTSCDIDILVHSEDLEKAISCLSENINYVEKERATHDVSMFSPNGIHLELHFDLVEEGRAQNAINVLNDVWNNSSLCCDRMFQYEMTDEFFYFYHIAHMAKHFETGGCGIRPYIDLWILDNVRKVDKSRCDALLMRGGLLKFAEASRALSRVWFCAQEMDELSRQTESFLFSGGIYGSVVNRVTLQQKKNGGRIGYIMSRMFVSYDRLKRYYPVLEKHKWLTPFMQVRRWFMLLKPDVAKRTKREIASNNNVSKEKAYEMNCFLNNIGL